MKVRVNGPEKSFFRRKFFSASKAPGVRMKRHGAPPELIVTFADRLYGKPPERLHLSPETRSFGD
jgi:hypothetical protein